MGVRVRVRDDIELGVWQGMGGAITEATAYNFSKLNKEKQEALLEAYYGKDGLDYRWGRVSIASNDFCLKSYEYTKSAKLEDFSIKHDERYILPLLKKILHRKRLTIMASPWSPPSCMKTTKILRFGGHLWPWHYRNYAKYIRKWLDAYAEEGIKIDYITPQNEPFARQIWESCLYSLRAQRKLAYRYLAKELEGIDTRILLWDHNKARLERVADGLLSRQDFGVDKKVAGLCFHWYDGTHSDKMWKVHEKYPDAMLVSSEMCCGFSRYDKKGWQRDAALYLMELMSDVNCGVSAWVDWNMLLDWQGGPSYCRNFVKSPVILNEDSSDYILTPIYGALKSFAQVFPAGSRVIRCESSSKKVVAVARRTDNDIEVILANVSREDHLISVELDGRDKGIILKPLEIKKVVFRR